MASPGLGTPAHCDSSNTASVAGPGPAPAQSLSQSVAAARPLPDSRKGPPEKTIFSCSGENACFKDTDLPFIFQNNMWYLNEAQKAIISFFYKTQNVLFRDKHICGKSYFKEAGGGGWGALTDTIKIEVTSREEAGDGVIRGPTEAW